MIDLIKSAKGSDFFSVIILFTFLGLLEHYINLGASDYIAIIGVCVLLYLHALSTRFNTKRFEIIEEQEIENEKRYLNDQRMRVLDKIGVCNTHASFNGFRLKQLLDTHSDKMDAEQLSNLNNLKPEMELQVNILDEMSDDYVELSNKITLDQINQDYARLINAEADGLTISKLIESGFESYE